MHPLRIRESYCITREAKSAYDSENLINAVHAARKRAFTLDRQYSYLKKKIEKGPSKEALKGGVYKSGPSIFHRLSFCGYLKAVWLKIFGPASFGFRQKIDPGTPLDRPGPPRTSTCTQNQLRRPIRGEGSLVKNSRTGFSSFRPGMDPGTPLDRRGLPGRQFAPKISHEDQF